MGLAKAVTMLTPMTVPGSAHGQHDHYVEQALARTFPPGDHPCGEDTDQHAADHGDEGHLRADQDGAQGRRIREDPGEVFQGVFRRQDLGGPGTVDCEGEQGDRGRRRHEEYDQQEGPEPGGRPRKDTVQDFDGLWGSL